MRNDFNRRFQDREDSFDRTFRWMSRLFWVFFVLIMVAIVAVCSFYGYVVYKAVDAGPEAIGEQIGKAVKGFEKGRQEEK